MDGIIGQFLVSIPAAATSPLAFVAYLATLVVWAIIAFRVRTLNEVGRTLETLAAGDRPEALRQALGAVRVGEFTPTEYIKHQISRYVFISFLVACVAAVVIAGLAAREVLDRKQLTEFMINEILDVPSSQYMSAVNVLNNGPAAIAQLATSMPPSASMEDLDAQIQRLAMQGFSQEQIVEWLRHNSGGGRLQKINGDLLRASARIEQTLANLADCFRNQRCVNTAVNMSLLCQQVTRVTTDARNSNLKALSIPGVTFAEGNSESLFGNGALDRFFREIRLPNATFNAKFRSLSLAAIFFDDGIRIQVVFLPRHSGRKKVRQATRTQGIGSGSDGHPRLGRR